MLILTRRIGETVVINGNIRVTILGSKGNQIRVGFEAPPDTPIDREEVHDRKTAEAVCAWPKKHPPGCTCKVAAKAV